MAFSNLIPTLLQSHSYARQGLYKKFIFIDIMMYCLKLSIKILTYGTFLKTGLYICRNHCSAAASAAAAAAAGFRPIPNSVSMPSVRSNTTSALGTYVVQQAQAQTQTEKKLSCLKQFLFCLLANQVISDRLKINVKYFLFGINCSIQQK